MRDEALVFQSVKSKLCLNLNTFMMASQFEEEHFFLFKKSNLMVTVTPFMGKLKEHIRQFYVNEKGEKKAWGYQRNFLNLAWLPLVR